jgi:hypothetical protein
VKSGPVRTSITSRIWVERGAWLAAATGLILSPAVFGQVLLREGRGEVAGRVAEVGPLGVGVDVDVDGRAVRRLVGWDRVKRVDGDKSAAAASLVPLSETLWRARSRLDRGDWLASEPLLTPLAANYAGANGRGPTAAVVFVGLLRCRLARGARAGAIGAWLELLATYERSSPGGSALTIAGWTRPSDWLGGSIEGLPVFDARTGLTPSLPPIWVGEPALEIASSRGEWTAEVPDAAPAVASELAAWYTTVGRFEAGTDAPWPKAYSDTPGPRLVRLIVQARTGDAAQRATARESLKGLLAQEGADSWEEAWCRAAIGRSLLREDDREQKIRGVVQLLHVPARLGRSSPYLAGVCLAEAAVTLADLGDAQAAHALRQELDTAYPGHPASAWSRLQAIKPPAAVAPAAPAKPEAVEVPSPAPAPAVAPPERRRR